MEPAELATESRTLTTEERIERAYAEMHERYRKRIFEHPMMKELRAGTLPMEVIRGFVKQFHAFVLGVNTSVRTLYKRELENFKNSPSQEQAFIEKARDEFCCPGPGGHIRTLERFGAAVGLKREEIIQTRLLPGALAYMEAVTAAIAHSPDMPMLEVRAFSFHEEPFGEFAKIWYDAMTTHYGLSHHDAEYFDVHYKADLSEHDGVMSHGDYNKMVLRKLLSNETYPKERKGWGFETCALLGVELFALLIDDVYEAYHPNPAPIVSEEWIGIEPNHREA